MYCVDASVICGILDIYETWQDNIVKGLFLMFDSSYAPVD